MKSEISTLKRKAQKRPTFNDTALRVVVWLCVLIWAAVGVLIGVVFVSALPFPVQMIAALSYLVIGLLGWLPWQIGRNCESD